jgi:NOL1/NOP2/sun family putative RNA methylase
MKRKDFAEIEARKREQFLQRLASIFGITTHEAQKFVSIDLLSSVRINPLRGDEEETEEGVVSLMNGNIEEIEWLPGTYIIRNEKEKLTQSTFATAGEIYIQNASSFIPVILLDPRFDEKILDICASPGGKCSHIAAVTLGRSELWANDLSRDRVLKLKKVLDLLGVKVAKLTTYPAQIIDKILQEKFDKVLLDAPCSGEGMLNLSKPEDIKGWSIKRIKRLQNAQKRMIVAAYNLLKPGGKLVYSTCTFAPEENELVVSHLLKKYPEAQIMPIDLPITNLIPALNSWKGKSLPSVITNAKRVRPNEYMEGFFVAVIEKPA